MKVYISPYKYKNICVYKHIKLYNYKHLYI